MIEQIPDLPEKVLGFSAKGAITPDDYASVIIPAVEAMASCQGKVRLLYHLGEDFTGIRPAAAWEDTKLGLRHICAAGRNWRSYRTSSGSDGPSGFLGLPFRDIFACFITSKWPKRNAGSANRGYPPETPGTRLSISDTAPPQKLKQICCFHVLPLCIQAPVEDQLEMWFIAATPLLSTTQGSLWMHRDARPERYIPNKSASL